MIRTGSKTAAIVEPSGLGRVPHAGSYLYATPDNPGFPRPVTIEPEGLVADLRRDAAPGEAQAERPSMSFFRRQAHRARKKALFDAKKTERS